MARRDMGAQLKAYSSRRTRQRPCQSAEGRGQALILSNTIHKCKLEQSGGGSSRPDCTVDETTGMEQHYWARTQQPTRGTLHMHADRKSSNFLADFIAPRPGTRYCQPGKEFPKG